MAPGGPLLNGGCCCCCCCGGCCCCWSPTPLLGPWFTGRNCSPTGNAFRHKAHLKWIKLPISVFYFPRLHNPFSVPTFPHVTKGVLVGFICAHAPLHVWCVHARLIGRVWRHILPGESRVTSFRERVLQVNTAPRRGAMVRRRKN